MTTFSEAGVTSRVPAPEPMPATEVLLGRNRSVYAVVRVGARTVSPVKSALPLTAATRVWPDVAKVALREDTATSRSVLLPVPVDERCWVRCESNYSRHS